MVDWLKTIILAINLVISAHLALIFFAICVLPTHAVVVQEPRLWLATIELGICLFLSVANLVWLGKSVLDSTRAN